MKSSLSSRCRSHSLSLLAAAAPALLGACSSGGGGTSISPDAPTGPTAPVGDANTVPAGLSYPSNPVTYLLGQPAPNNTPAASGGGLTFSVDPELPSGLALQPFTGNIFGEPFEGSLFALYTVSASNSLGSTATTIAVAVEAPPPPKNVVYPASPASLTIGTDSGSLSPSFDGTAVGFQIRQSSGLLPAGMSFDQKTGTIQGTPADLSSPLLLAIDAYGFDAIALAAADGAADDTGYLVVEVLGSGVTAEPRFLYAEEPLVVEVGETVQDLPVIGLATYALAPESDVLPAGLTLNPVSGAIQGVPSLSTPPLMIIVDATLEAGGARRALLPLEVRSPAAPRELTYPSNPVSYVEDVTVQPNLPSVEGQGLSFAVSPSLPAGLSLDPLTGAIEGKPTQTTAKAVYAITATNAEGSTLAGVLLDVVPAGQAVAPSSLSYADPAPSYGLDLPIAPNAPSVVGDVASWSASPELPAGLSLDAGTGLISGTPTASQAPTTHAVTATGPAGSTSADVMIEVALQAPDQVAYAENPVLYTKDLSIEDNLASVLGAVDTWSITPSLPGGLTLDSVSGTISGTPTVVQSTTDHIVSAQNAAGNGKAFLRLTVLDPSPPNAEFSATPTSGEVPLTVAFTSLSTGAVASYDWDFGDGGSSAAENPTHVFNSAGNFDVSLTVDGSFGSDVETKLGFIVVNTGGPLDNLEYPDPVYAVERALPPQAPTFDGLATSFALAAGSDPLPEGVVLDPVTGSIFGQPQILTTAPLNVIIEATNGAETTSVSLPMEIGLGSARAAWVANNLEGTLSQYSFNANTGQLLPRGHVAAPSPFALDLLRNNSYLVAANNLDDSLSVFAVDAATGDLSEVAGSPFALSGAGANVPQAVQASPDSNFVYVAAQTSDLVYGYSIDAGTGALAELASSPFGPFDGAGSLATARLAGADFLFLLAREEGATPVYSFSIGADGSLTQLSALSAGSGPVELVFDRQGSVLYVVNNLSADVSAYAAATDGTLSELANSPYDVPSSSNGPRTLDVANLASGERFLYLAFDDTDLAQFEIEPNGDLTQLLPPSLATGTAPVDLVLDPGGSFAYIANLGQDSLSVFAPSTQPGEVGALQFVTGLPAVRTQGGPSAIEFFADQSPAQLSATALYAANNGSNDLSQFTASSFDGSLIPLVPTSVAGGQASNWIEVRKDGDFAYLTNSGDASSTVSVYSIDTGGELSPVQDVAQAQGAITGHLSPGGDFLQLVQLVEELVLTYPVGQDGLLGASTDSEAIGGIARVGTYDNTGLNFYVSNELDETISQFAADPVTGQLTPLAPATVSSGTGLRALAVHPSGLFLYGSAIGSPGAPADSLSSFSIDLSSGALTEHTTGPTSNVDDDPIHLAVHPGGTLLYVACRGDSSAQSGSIQTYGINTNPNDGAEDGIIIPFPVTQSIPGSPSHLRFSPAGDLLYVGLEDADAQVLTYAVSISPVTLTLIDTDSTGVTTRSLALRPLVQ